MKSYHLDLQLKNKKKDYYPQFTELKGIAILMILMYRSGGVLGIFNYLHGEVGVDIFLIISGSLLTFNYYNNKTITLSFLKKRLIKIVPLYWIILSLIIFFKKYLLNIKFENNNILYHYLGIQGFSRKYFLSINDSLWFFTIILLCYILFFYFFKYIKKNQEKLVIFGFSTSMLLQVLAYFINFSAFQIHFATRIISFILGIILALKIKNKLKINIDWKIILTFLVQSYLIIMFNPPVIYSIMGIIITLLYLRLNLKKSIINNILLFFGSISFELFLIHQPLIREFNIYFLNRYLSYNYQKDLTLLFGVTLFLIISIVLSIFLKKINNSIYKFLLK